MQPQKQKGKNFFNYLTGGLLIALLLYMQLGLPFLVNLHNDAITADYHNNTLGTADASFITSKQVVYTMSIYIPVGLILASLLSAIIGFAAARKDPDSTDRQRRGSKAMLITTLVITVPLILFGIAILFI